MLRCRRPMDYKATLNLPQTAFPMKANLPQREPEILARWERERLYERIQEAGKGKPLYVLHDGPPYANGRIHIGHALNKVLKDIIVKSKTMEGCHAPYVPGWDCHGLPIEHQVLKELGDKKKSLGKVEIRKLCREYAGKFFKVQREEFQRLGVLGDWNNPYLTMTHDYETALAEAEVEYEDHTSPSIYVKFPFTDTLTLDLPQDVQEASVLIWTTTPWTLPANQALCINPLLTYAFIKVGSEAYLIAKDRVEAVAKACGFSEYEIIREQLGGEYPTHDLEFLRCKRPLSSGLSPILFGDFVTLDQ